MSKETDDLITNSENEDVMFFSRPFALPGKAFGSLNMFFHPSYIHPKEMEELGRMVASYIDDYFIKRERSYANSNGEVH